MRLDDPSLVAREYSSLGRVAMRRLDRSGWLRGFEPIPTLLAAVSEARPGTVLDAGCGTAEIAALVSAPRVVCVDQSLAAVEAAATRGLETLKADIVALPFDDDSFDVVMCNWVLYHLADLDSGLSELARVCKRGGRFVGAYNLPGHLSELWSAVGHTSRWDRFDGESGIGLLERHFVEVERRDTSGEVLWEDEESLQAYLDAYRVIAGEIKAPTAPYPFVASCRNCVLVAHKR
jgi:SAM-dependent methyltransferase